MGNKLVRRRQVVDEKYTKPQGLYQHRDVDPKKLRKLILHSKLAPCYPGDDESVCDLEECPICFLYYPSLNRSRCCMKGICTECFLQMKTPNSTRPTQCPFCKTLNYAVEYRGVKTNEEKATEQVEEQKVIEAKLRIRQQELQDEEDRMQRQREVISSLGLIGPGEGEYSSIAVPTSLVVDEEIVCSQQPRASPTIRQPLHPRQNRDDEFDLYLEDMMVMEAIWLSIQEKGRHQNQVQVDDDARSEQDITEDRRFSGATTPVATSSFTCGGLSCATASLAEHQQTGGETSTSYIENMLAYNNNMLPGYGALTMRADRQLAMTGDYGEWGVNHGFEVGGGNSAFSQEDEIESGFQTVAGPIVSENFEEQMMTAMAVLPVESQARTRAPGVPWH